MSLLASDKFQVIFEGVVGNGYAGDIALDDVFISKGECVTPGSCDFEHVSFEFCL